MTALVALGLGPLAAVGAHAQACEGGAYLNPQLFRGDAAHQRAIAEQEFRSFVASAGLPTAPMQSVKHVNDITASGRKPPCWLYANVVVGSLSAYKPIAVNLQPIKPAVMAITRPLASGPANPRPVALKDLPADEQKAVLDQLQRSRCLGTASGVETAIVRAEGLCGMVEEVAPKGDIGQQGLIAAATFAWDESAWTGIATRAGDATELTTKNLISKSPKVHNARLVIVPAKGAGVGFGLYAHPSLPDDVVRKAADAFKALANPSKPLSVALDIEPGFQFASPSAQQMEKLAADVGVRR